jgi:RNA polymerase sigma-70 factor (ECF subfamily)
VSPPAEVADDRALVHAAQAGERSALDALLRRHHDRILSLCRRLTGNEADALDACQEALIAIVRGLPRFDGRSAFTTWSYRVATNACLDELRRRGRRPALGLPDDHDRLARGASAPATGIEVLPDRLAVDSALAQLPEEFRVAVVLRDLCDLEYADIAGALGVPAGTVRSRIARGRSLLAGLLADGRAGGNPGSPAERRTQAGTDR